MLQNVKSQAFFNGTIPFCDSFNGGEFNPINTSSVSVIPVAHSFTLLHDTFDWNTDVKLKLKVGVVFVTMEQQVLGL